MNRMNGQITLHGRRLRLSATQARRLSALLARPGHLVRVTQVGHPACPESAAGLAKAISRLRGVLQPHGYDIYAVVGRGFLLAPLEEPEPEPEGKEGC